MRSNGANLQVNQDSTQLAHAIVTCRNIKCLLIQLLIEVLCLCQVRRQKTSAASAKGDPTQAKSDVTMKEEALEFQQRKKLNIDYTGVFHCKLG